MATTKNFLLGRLCTSSYSMFNTRPRRFFNYQILLYLCYALTPSDIQMCSLHHIQVPSVEQRLKTMMLPTLVRCKVQLDPANCSIFWVKYQQNLLKLLCSLIIGSSLLPLNPFSPLGSFFMHVNSYCSVHCSISRADTFLQVNCGQNGQSLFKDFVNLISRLVMIGREKFKRSFLKS